MSPAGEVTSTLSPSKLANCGWFSPFPVNVARTTPVAARTTETDEDPMLGTQRFPPSNTGKAGCVPTVTVCRMAPAASSLNSFPTVKSVTQTLEPSKSAPVGAVKPVPTVVTVQGTTSPGVTIDTEGPEKLAVQIRTPSKAIPIESSPRLLATVETAPAGCAARTWFSLPGLVFPVRRTRPMATTNWSAFVAPVQVSSNLPSLPRTRETVPESLLATQMSAPSEATPRGRSPTEVVESRTGFWILQNISSAARRLPRSRTRSTVRDKNAAIWRRVTLSDGENVVGVVPVVIPSVKISSTNGQNVSLVVSVNGPQTPSSEVEAPAAAAAMAARQIAASRREPKSLMDPPAPKHANPGGFPPRPPTLILPRP